MSSPNKQTPNRTKSEGGSYVPPHRRRDGDNSQSPRNTNNNSPYKNQFPPRTMSHDSTPSPRRPFHSNNQKSPPRTFSHGNNNNNKKRYNNQHRHHGPGRGGGGGRGARSRSPGRQQGGTRSRSPGKHHHHHVHLTKEQLQHQREQLHVLTEAITRICCINLERRPDRWASFQQHLHQSLGKKMGHSLSTKIQRYNAVDGIGAYETELPQLVQTTWDATINAKWDRHITPPMTKEMSAGEVGCALSHIQLWRELADLKLETPPENELQQPTMMILEDDALFYSPKLAMNKQAVRELSPTRGKAGVAAPITYNHDFLTAFQLSWTQLPEDWDIWYLGFSDRGERLPVDKDFHLPKHHHHDNKHPTMTVQLFRPTYGFHTHGYVLTAKAAKKLLENLPVTGPLDVWLADNQWFDMKVYCSVVEGEGWHETGAWLITQNRKANSNIPASGRTENNNNNNKS